MDVQGFGDTFATGFYQTASSGFKPTGYMGGTVRSTQSFKVNNKVNKVTRGSIVDNAQENNNPLMTEGGNEDEDEERRAQMEFEQQMRASNMSFFKTAKSTFMSSNGQSSSYQAWGTTT